jgi:hypothetical protein
LLWLWLIDGFVKQLAKLKGVEELSRDEVRFDRRIPVCPGHPDENVSLNAQLLIREGAVALQVLLNRHHRAISI